MNFYRKKSEFTRNVLTLMTGTAIAQAIPLAISPILTRIYSPEDFGVFALYMAIAGTAAVVSNARYEHAVILPKRNSVAQQVVLLSLFILTIYTLLGFGLSVTGYFIYNYNPIFLTLPLIIAFISINHTLDRYSNRVKDYKLMSAQRMAKSTVESLTSVAIGFFAYFRQGLIVGSFFGYFSATLLLLFRYMASLRNAFKLTSKRKIAAVAKRYRNFPKFNMPHALLNSASANIPIVLIPLFYGSATLGFYAFGLRIIQAPLGLVSQSVYNVLSQKFAELHGQGKDLRPLFWSTLKKLGVIALGVAPMLVFADDIFAIVFGAEWRIAGEYIRILSIWILLSFAVSCFAAIPMIYHQQRKALILEILYTLARIAPFLIGAYYFSLDIKDVLLLYATLSTLLLIYGISWYYHLIKSNA